MPATPSEMSIAPSPSVGIAHPPSDPRSGNARLLPRGFRHHDRELVAADPKAVVGDPRFVEDSGDRAEDLVPGGVAEPLIDAVRTR